MRKKELSIKFIPSFAPACRRGRRRIPHFALALLFSVATVSAEAPAPVPPNIIILLTDTLRADYLGCYGFDGDVSPNIDRLARESIRFDRCIAPAPWTKPSVASLFTSLHPQTHRVTDHLGMHWKTATRKQKASVLADEAVTLAEVLSGVGYDTLGFVGNDFLIRKFGYGQGFTRYYEPRPHSDVFSATPLLERAWKLLDGGEVKEPFFMYFHFMDVHGPFQCADDDFRAVAESPSLGEERILTWAERGRIPKELGAKIPWRGREESLSVRNWRSCYAAGVRKFDRRLGPFLDRLRASGVLDRTVVVFTSDHGEELYDHGGWAHSHTLHNELLNVPLLVRMPGGRRGGARVDSTVSLIDVMPTLLALAEPALKMDGIAGRDLSAYLRGGDAGPEVAVFGTATRHDPGMISMENGRYKLIWNYPNAKPALYDLRRDPLERHDIAERRPRVSRRMSRMVVRHLQRLEEQGSLRETSTQLSDELIERLRALGYVQ